MIPDNYPNAAGLQPAGHDLAGIRTSTSAGSTTTTPTAKRHPLPSHWRPTSSSANAFGKYDAPSRFSEWNREFDEMLAKDPTGGAVPAS